MIVRFFWILALIGTAHAATLSPVLIKLPEQSSHEAFSLTRDANGFIWVGTGDGLYRFDGLRFLRVGAEPDTGLRSQNAGNLLLDRQQRLWVGTWGGGLHRVDTTNLSVQHMALPSTKVQSLFQDHAGRLWFGTPEHGLFGWDGGSQFQQVAASAELRIWDICELADGTLWLAADDGLARWSPESDNWQFWSSKADNAYGFPHRQVRAVHCSDEGEVWVSTRGGMGRFDPVQQRFEAPQNDLSISFVLNRLDPVLDDPTRLWMASVAGLLRFNLSARVFEQPFAEHSARTLPNQDIRDVLAADAQHLWLATRYDGLKLARFDQRKWQQHGVELQRVSGGTEMPAVSTLMTVGDELLIGSSAGLIRRDMQSGSMHLDAQWREPVRALRMDNSGALWLLTNGLYRQLPDGNITNYSSAIQANGLDPLSISDIQPLPNGELIFTAGYGPLRQLDPASARIIELNVPGLAQAQGNNLRLSADGRLWVSTFADSIFVRDPNAGFWSELSLRVNQRDHLLYDLILAPSGAHVLTSQSGVLRYTPESGRFEEMSLITGPMPIGAGLIDIEGALWLGSAQGLLRIDAHGQQSLFRYDADTSQISTMAMDSQGRIFLGNRDGLMSFAAAAPTRLAPPRVQVVGILLDEKPLPYAQLQTATVPANTRLIELELATPTVLPETPRLLRYRIRELSPDWRLIDAQTSDLQLGGLAPGRYQIELTAALVPEQYGPITSLNLQVLPPWYRDPRWIAALLLLLTFSLIAVYRWRIRAHITQRRRLEALVEDRTRALAVKQQQLLVADKMASLGMLTAGVAHEINNPVAFTQAAAQNLSHELEVFGRFLRDLASEDADPELLAAIESRLAALREQAELSLDGTRRIQAIVRDLRLFARLDEADRKSANLEDALRATLRLVETHYQKTVEIRLDFCGDASIECWPAELNQVFMNLIVNACQALASQGPRQPLGTLTIRTRRETYALCIDFIDDGPGIEPALQERIFEPLYSTKVGEQGLGLGLSISRELVEKQGGSLRVHSTPGQGACFSVRLPLQGQLEPQHRH